MAVALAQIGEFSFILSTLGRELGLLTAEATNTLVAASIVSIVAQSAAVPRHRADRAVGRRGVRGCAAMARSAARSSTARGARAVRRAERRAHRAVVDRLRTDRTHGGAAAAGERHRADGRSSSTSTPCASCASTASTRSTATRRVRRRSRKPASPTAGNLILTSAGMANSEEVIRAARDVNPDIRVLARALVPARPAEPEARRRRHRVHRRG